QKPKSEFLIPTVVSDLIQTGEATVRVLRTSARWFGVTYREDKPFVQKQVQSLVNQGIYPHHLWT
ncbi:MAG: nucleotidyltransferase, partial [Rhodothermales bacterium]